MLKRVKKWNKEVFLLIKMCRQRLVRDRALQRAKTLLKKLSKIKNVASAASNRAAPAPHHTQIRSRKQNVKTCTKYKSLRKIKNIECLALRSRTGGFRSLSWLANVLLSPLIQ